MTKIINGEVIATIRFKLDISLEVPENEIPLMIDELFSDGQPHTLQEFSDRLKQFIEVDMIPANGEIAGAKAICHQSDVTREA